MRREAARGRGAAQAIEVAGQRGERVGVHHARTRGLEPGDALAAAVYLHGLAGDIAAGRQGQESLIAGDVVDSLPAAFAQIGAGH